MTKPIDTTFTGRLDPDQIGAVGHQFHNAEYAQEWADRYAANPSRTQLFSAMIAEISQHIESTGESSYHVVELGVGPGYLALDLLNQLPTVTYEGVDFSAPMIEIARARLTAFADRIAFTRVDLTGDDWGKELQTQPNSMVSTWALHDLGHPDHIQHVYSVAAQTLPSGGILLNGDFVKPEGVAVAYEAGRVPIAKHLDMLAAAGFEDSRCLISLEEDSENPTASNNYACMMGALA